MSGDGGESDSKPLKIEDEAVVEEAGAEIGRVSGGAPGSEDSARVLERREGSDGAGVKEEMEEGARVSSEVKDEDGSDELDADPDGSLDEEDDDEEDQTETENSSAGDAKGEVYTSLLSEFEAYVANEKNGAMLGTSRALSFGFEVGDMVWGKVKSHPWWPGHIFNEAQATSSVRRTRREGHVLVAFFGDSSYGWFDPAELISFELHFAEKSQQTSSRTFTKAVEEAVDEASRRCGLALVCRCRSKCNFRPTNIAGYFEVDVPEYEANGVYSGAQIRKAREGFQPRDMLAFLKRVAPNPVGSDPDSIDYIRYKATASAFRTAVFEEFDETYGEAFGLPNSRGSDEAGNVPDQPVRTRTLAPLSGPLVIAEALRGGNKSSKKPMKIKDRSKKDKYLFKRRDEPSEQRTTQPIALMEATPSAPAAIVEGSSAIAAGDFVLQKRAPAAAVPPPPSSSSSTPERETEVHPIPENKVALVDTTEAVSGTLDAGRSESSGKGMPSSDGSSSSSQQVNEAMAVDLKNEESAKASGPIDGSLQDEQSFSDRANEEEPLDAPQRNTELPVVSGKVKKAKIPKRPLPEGSSADTVMVEKKKRKKKNKELGSETGTEEGLQMGKMAVKRKGKSTLASLGNLTLLTAGLSETEVELPHILKDLHALALNPFHGAQLSSRPVGAVQFFLRFRSRVYQKSLATSPPHSETDPSEARASKSDGENVKAVQPLSKLAKSTVRQDDPSKVGRKRLPSDRQEEMVAKKMQKLGQMKSLQAEKRAGMRSSFESPRIEGKEPVTTAPQKPLLPRPDTLKRSDPPPPRAKSVEPTMLVMKFPPQTSLPSAAELKARFARFGSLDQSATRVFWKSSTCRVVFRYKQDAESAIKYATRNSYLFGNVDVRYTLREVASPAAEVAAPEIDRADPPMPIERGPYQPVQNPNLPIKSILKKPNGDETGDGNGNGRGGNRVKFVLGGEEKENNNVVVGRSEPPLMMNSITTTSTTTSTTSVGMDFNSKSFQNSNPLLPPLPPPPPPPPPQFAKPPLMMNNPTVNPSISSSSSISQPRAEEAFAVPRNLHQQQQHSMNALPLPPPPPLPQTAAVEPSVDVSRQMLSLLTRCSDVVAGVSGWLGYVPYHPL